METIITYVDIFNRQNRDEETNELLRDDHYQTVYSSQVYGTFFSVIAKFNLNLERSNKSNGVYCVKSIDFMVANYKGILNIGIQNVISPVDLMAEVNKNEQVKRKDSVKAFIFEMRAMGGFDDTEEGSRQPEDKFTLAFDGDGMIFNSKDLLYFRRVQKHLHSDTTKLKKGIFDDEFYFREGIDEMKFEKRKFSEIDKKVPDFSQIRLAFAGGPLCPESQSFVI